MSRSYTSSPRKRLRGVQWDRFLDANIRGWYFNIDGLIWRKGENKTRKLVQKHLKISLNKRSTRKGDKNVEINTKESVNLRRRYLKRSTTSDN
jgi:hypothetical protein